MRRGARGTKGQLGCGPQIPPSDKGTAGLWPSDSEEIAHAHAYSTPDTPHSATAGGGHEKEAAHEVATRWGAQASTTLHHTHPTLTSNANAKE